MEPTSNQPKRAIGTWQLMFIAISSMVGSSWLFAALYTSQMAGPAGIFSVIIGGLIILIIGLVFAEVASLFPLGGGSARLPFISHGGLAAYMLGFINWVAYVAVAPLEVTALLEYTADIFPWLAETEHGEKRLTFIGVTVAVPLLFVFVILNNWGVRLLARLNQPLALWKLAVPIVTVAAFLLSRFEVSNFTAAGGFAPYGVSGVLGAVAGGGCVIAYLGFRSVLEMAGEVRRPGRDIPLAMIGSIIFCIILYGLLNISFVGALGPDELQHGWSGLAGNTAAGPIAGLALTLGLVWLATLLMTDAVVSPGGTALIYTGVSARVGRAMSRNGTFPGFLSTLNRHGVPARGIFFNFVIGVILLMPFPGWQSLMGLISSAIVLSLGFGPIALLAFRRQFPDRPRPFRLPAGKWVAAVSFVLCTFTVYWAGWKTNAALCILVLAAALLLPLILRGRRSALSADMEWRSAIWLGAYFGSVFVCSWLGQYGGREILPHGIDLLVLGGLSLGVLALAHSLRRPNDRAASAADDPELVVEEVHEAE